MANPDKRWDFKVSIHCEGCKRKVQKIVQNIKGIEKVDIDLKQHKVSIHGNVDPQTVIWKLDKSGKHAELWPQKEKTDSREKKKKTGKDKSGEKQSSSQEGSSDRSVQENGKGEETSAEKGVVGEGEASGGSKGEVLQKPTVVENRDDADAAEKETPGGGQSSTDANKGDANTNVLAGGNCDGNGRRKKKNKGQNGKKETSECNEVSGGSDLNNGRSNQGPPHLRPEHAAQTHGRNCVPPLQVLGEHNYGDYNDPPPPLQPRHYSRPPVYAVNLHTAHPASSYSASQYYDPPPINSYPAYMHPRPEDHQPYYDPYHQRPSESFQLFSDENPNSCSLM